MLKDLAGDTLKYLIAKVIVSLSWIITLKVYTAALNPAGYGAYSLIFSVQTYALVFSSSWLAGSILRFESIHRKESLGLFSQATAYLSARSVAFLALPYLVTLALIRYFFDLPITPVIFGILIFSFFLNTWLAAVYSLLRARRRLVRYIFVYGLQTVIGIFLSVLFLKFFDSGITGILLGQALGCLPALVMLKKDERIAFRFELPEAEKRIAAEMFRYGLPILWINLFTQILSSSDQFILRRMGYADGLGRYAAQYMLAQNSILAFTSLVSSALGPLLFERWENGESGNAFKNMNRLALGFTAVTLPAVGAVWALQGPILHFLFKPEFFPQANEVIIPYVCLGAFFVGLANIFSEAMTLSRKTKLLASCYGVAAILNIGLNLLFVPQYGLQAAAITSLIAYFALFVGIWFAFQRIKKTVGVSEISVA